MRASTVVGSVLGAALLVWAIVHPQPVLYVCGVLLVALTAGGTLASARRSRAEQRAGRRPASRRARWAASGLGTGLGAVLTIVLVGIPLLGRWLPAHEGMLWQADVAGGNPAVHAGRLYVAYWQGTGPAGTSVNTFDLADGTLGLDVAGWVFLTEEGDLVARHEGTIHYYDPSGQQLWEAPAPHAEDATTGVFAAAGGHVATGYCSGTSQTTTLDCHLVGLDPAGDQAWTRDVVVDSSFMESDEDRALWATGAPLPAALSIRTEDADRALLLDPSTGEPLLRYSSEGLPSQQVYGDVLLVVGQGGAGCTLDAYQLSEGTRLWRQEDVCTGQQLLSPIAPVPGTDAPATAYLRVQDPAEQSIDRMLAVQLTDGSVQEIAARDVAGFATNPTTDLWTIQDALADDLVLRWSGTAVTAASAADGQQQWQVEVPGTAVRKVVGAGHTVAIISYDDGAGHNPFVPPPEQHSDSRSWPTHVTVVDGATGETISTTWFADGVDGVAVPAPHQVFVQSGRQSMLVGEQPDGG